MVARHTEPLFRGLNEQYGLFARPPNPATMLAPAVLRLLQLMLEALELLQKLISAHKVRGWGGEGCQQALAGHRISKCLASRIAGAR